MKTIALDRIRGLDNDFDFFSSSPEFDITLVKEGICPPVVISGNKLVWGYSLLAAAERAGIKDLNYVEIDADGHDLICIALKLENRAGSYSWAEKEAFYKFMKSNLVEASDNLLSLVQPEGSFIKTTEKYSQLNDSLKKYVLLSEIDLKTACRLNDLPEEIFHDIFASAKFSFASRRLFLTYLLEIFKRDSMSEKELADFTRDLLEKDDPLKLISLDRYPNLEEMKKAMEDFRNDYVKKTGITLKEPDFFEGNSFSVSFNFSSEKQLDRIISSLGKIKEKSGELFRLL